MKVRDLIKELKKYPEEMEVIAYDKEYDVVQEINTVAMSARESDPTKEAIFLM